MKTMEMKVTANERKAAKMIMSTIKVQEKEKDKQTKPVIREKNDQCRGRSMLS